jgi:hypothetical protein
MALIPSLATRSIVALYFTASTMWTQGEFVAAWRIAATSCASSTPAAVASASKRELTLREVGETPAP